MDTFEEYLTKKKIDSAGFQGAKPGLWESWKSLFEQLHPNSFTNQKLFLINTIRREFPGKDAEPTTKNTGKPRAVVPKMNIPKKD